LIEYPPQTNLTKLFGEIFAKIGISEHALQATRVLEATHLFQLRDHDRLSVIASRQFTNQSFGQHFRIELLKDVLVIDVLENDDLKL
jgi:hypothetical protein